MLCFLKLGGSLITDKATPYTVRPEALARLVDEIAAARRDRPDLRLVLGHGSGSFGHAEAHKYGTRGGVHSAGDWHGFAIVSAAAAKLNRLVADALLAGGVPAVTLQPSASAICHDGRLARLALDPIGQALENGLCPLLYGDVAFDETRGGTIISTEDIFRLLARHLRPARILLAGLETGVYSDWPDGRTVVARISLATAPDWARALSGSHVPDVTGGMASKVNEMLALSQEAPGLETIIFSGEQPGNVYASLVEDEAPFGTKIGKW
jgi:isopentenyl phosphate kinase